MIAGLRSGIVSLRSTIACRSTAPPTVIVREPPVYIEQQPVPPAGSAPAAPQQYWYYCEPAGGYYPGVQTCSEPWVKVPARPQE